MSGLCNARGANDVESRVSLVAVRGSSTVESDAYASRGTVGPLVVTEAPLRGKRRGDGVIWSAEDGEQLVADGVDLVALVG